MTDIVGRPDGVLFAANQPNSIQLTQSWLRSDDGGTTWFTPAATPEVRWIDAKGFADDSNGLVTYRQWIRRTHDGGETWIASELDPDRSSRDVAFARADRWFLATTRTSGGGDLLRSTDGGANWTVVAGGLPTGSLQAGTVEFWDENNGVVAGLVGSVVRLYRTSDGGDSWQMIAQNGLPTGPSDLVWLAPGVGVAAVQASQTPGIYRTTNAGATWTQVSTIRSSQLAFRDGQNGAAVSSSGDTVLLTDDAGATWTEEYVPFHGPGPGIQFSYVNAVWPREDGWVIGGSNNRIVIAIDQSPASVDPTVPYGSSFPGGCRILEALPNPLSPTTTLRLELAVSTPVRVTFHDASGRRVRLLTNGQMESGQHTVSWDGRNDGGQPVAAGIYLARVLGAGTMDSAKLIVAK
jgi:photosystem II stability/assembly factor-like uncharacterized protein